MFSNDDDVIHILDDRIVNVLLENTSADEGRFLISAFSIMNKVSTSSIFNTVLDILTLETKLINIICMEDFNPIDFINRYKTEVSLYLADFLDREGIALSRITFSNVLEILTSILCIEEHDISFINTAFAILDNGYSENEEVLATFTNYMISDDLDSVYKIELVESLLEVTDELINRLRRNCSERLENEEGYVSTSIYMLVKLEKMNKEYIDNNFIKFLFKNIKDDKIKYNIEELYNIAIDYIKDHDVDIDLLFKVIYQCFCFSDTEITKEVIENLNYDVLNIDELKINVLKKKLEDILLK